MAPFGRADAPYSTISILNIHLSQIWDRDHQPFADDKGERKAKKTETIMRFGVAWRHLNNKPAMKGVSCPPPSRPGRWRGAIKVNSS
jgi:hypothetical protein